MKEIKDVNGKAPIARSHHSAIFTKNNHYLVIYGGRNDSLYKNEDDNKREDNVALGDLALFNLRLL